MNATSAPDTPVAGKVWQLRTVISNLFAVAADDGGWTLVDAGVPFSATRIRRWVSEMFGMASRPRSIVLTHGHFDHVGALRELADEWDVPVYAHPLEMPYITGKSKYPPPDPTVGGGGMAYLSFLYPRGPIDIGSRATRLPADGTVPGLPEWRWIHTPGHTAGHVSFLREQDRVLIAGDAVVTTKATSALAVATQRQELHGPPAYYTYDWEAAGQSVERLAGLQPSVLVTGHGLPMYGAEAAQRLEELAASFFYTEVPLSGRYVGHPAVTDEEGIVMLPPPPVNPVAPLLVTAAVAGVALYAYRRSRRAA